MKFLRRSMLAAALAALALGASSLIVATTAGIGTAGGVVNAASSMTAPVPPGAATTPQEGLSDISCPSLSSCVAVGTYTSAASKTTSSSVGAPSPMEITLANGTWSAFGLALPSDANFTSPQSTLNSISCPAAGSCVAVGQYTLAAGGQHPLIESLGTGGVWTAQNGPLPSDAGTNTTLESVSCPAIGSCVAVGSMNENGADSAVIVPIIETLSGGTWTVSVPTLPSNAYTGTSTTAPTGPQALLAGVSCPSTGTCEAVGSYNITSGTTAPLVEGLSNGTWTSQFAPSPATTSSGGPTTDSALFSAVSCSGTGACVAGGSYSATSSPVATLLDSLSGSAWTIEEASSVPGAYLVGIACPSAAYCLATGHYAGVSNATVIEIDSSGTWVQSTVPTPANATSPSLGGVSCLSANACAVVGSYEATNGQQGFIDTGVNQGSTGSGTGGGVSPDGHAVGIAATPDGQGYWIATSTGVVEAFGDATSYGDLLGTILNKSIVAITPTPDGKGYWLLGADGGVFAYGDAGYYGSTGNLHLNKPVVGMATTANGRGYWFVAADGGVFAYGDAVYQGSTGAMRLNRPVVGMAADPVTGGYWLVAADGGIFAFKAPYDGSTGGLKLNAPIVGMEGAANGSGYRFVASDGGIFTFGLPYQGSEAQGQIPAPIVGMAATGTNGYWLVDQLGDVYSFGGTGYYGGGL